MRIHLADARAEDEGPAAGFAAAAREQRIEPQRVAGQGVNGHEFEALRSARSGVDIRWCTDCCGERGHGA
jgi:hypothetical protein